MKKYLFTILILILVLFCIIHPNLMIDSTKSSISLWATVILPSLFPFIILSSLIQNTALPLLFGKVLTPFTKLLFGLPGISSTAIFLGMIGGYPIGAKVTNDLLNDKSINLHDANHLITFVNNSGPLFMIGAIGIGIYKNIYIGILLLLSHYISSILIGFIGRFLKQKNNNRAKKSNINFKILKLNDIGNILTDSIKKSIDIVLTIGGFIIIFGILSTMLEQTKILSLISNSLLPMLKTEVTNGVISGILEVTSGINKIATVNIPLLNKIIITSILVGFGGISIHFQTLSIISKSGINFAKYIIGKAFQGLLSGLITYLLITYTTFSKLIPTTTSTFNILAIETNKIFNTLLTFFIFIVLFKLFQILSHKTKTN